MTHFESAQLISSDGRLGRTGFPLRTPHMRNHQADLVVRDLLGQCILDRAQALDSELLADLLNLDALCFGHPLWLKLQPAFFDQSATRFVTDAIWRSRS